MKDDSCGIASRRKSSAARLWLFALAITLLVSLALPARSHAQSSAQTPANQAAGQTPPNQPSATRPAQPQWEIDAGRKLAFEVASVKQDTAEPSPSTVSSNVPLGPQDLFTPTGGLLRAANYPLIQYMVFAYKLTANQIPMVLADLPKWVTTDRYDIEARADGNPTKDQFRLMMQALLADRFKLAGHWETRQLSVLALVVTKPGKFGPQFRQHPDADGECSIAQPPPGTQGPLPTTADGFPQICGAVVGLPATNPGRLRVGARNVPLAMLTTVMNTPQLTGVDRPVLDKTGLTGRFDFVIEFTPSLSQPLPPGANFTPDPSGPSFLEALQEQLGLKLETETGPVDVFVVDHLERPSEN